MSLSPSKLWLTREAKLAADDLLEAGYIISQPTSFPLFRPNSVTYREDDQADGDQVTGACKRGGSSTKYY